MKIDFLEKEDLNWDDFVIQNNGSFLQSNGWFQFNNRLGNKVFRIIIKDDKKTIFQTLIVKKKYLYIPYGPIFDENVDKKEVMHFFLEKIKRKAVFLRIEPFLEIIWPEGFNYKESRVRLQPKKTLILDLRKTEEELLVEFQKNCRYNIGLAQRKGVKVSIKEEYDPKFYSLLQKVSKRNDFRIFKEEHYRNFFEINDKNFKAKLFLGSYREKIISAYIVVFFNKTATCLHGATDLGYKKIKATNFLVWERVKYAKKNGYNFLDLWGIDENRWPGITDFKKSFGGTTHNYPDSRDIVFNKTLYSIYGYLKKAL